MLDIVHLTDSHCGFDDRIFYKELHTLSSEYKCHELVVSCFTYLTDMGGAKKNEGVYDNINCVPITFFGKNSFCIKIIRKFLPPIYNRLKYFGVSNKIIKYFTKNNITPSIIHCHDLSVFKLAKKIAKKCNCKLLFDCHEYYFSFPFNRGFNKKTLHQAGRIFLKLKRAYKQSDYVITVSKLADDIVSILRNDELHTYIPNNAILNFDVEKNKNIENRKLILVHEGMLKFNYGLKLMINMFSDEFIRSNFKLKIIGKLDKEEKKYALKTMKELNLNSDNIEFTGWIPYVDLPKYLKGDVGIIFFDKIINSYFSLPNRLYNYHCAGLPIVTAHCADSTDEILRTKTGVVFERNLDSLKIALKEIKNNYYYYYNNVLENKDYYSWKSVESRLLNIYKSLLEK